MVNTETSKIIAEKIASLRTQANESQQALADSIGVKRETVKFWESGERQIKGSDIVKIAQHFNVSTDYLLGLCEVKSTNHSLQVVCKYTGLHEDTAKLLYPSSPISRTLNDIIPEYGFAWASAFEEIGRAVLTAKLTHEKLSSKINNADAAVTYYGEYRDMIQNIELALFRFSEQCRILPDIYGASQTVQELNAFVWANLE